MLCCAIEFTRSPAYGTKVQGVMSSKGEGSAINQPTHWPHSVPRLRNMADCKRLLGWALGVVMGVGVGRPALTGQDKNGEMHEPKKQTRWKKRLPAAINVQCS